MIREDRFLISRKPYAINPTSLTISERRFTTNNTRYFDIEVTAVWFRRKHGILSACIGTLQDFQDEKPDDATAFLTAHTDGRYGGTCFGRWNGIGYWGRQNTFAQQEQHLAVLRPMLDDYPTAPTGFDGWWTYQEPTR